MHENIYKFEDKLDDSRLVEPIKKAAMYDIRKMAEAVKSLGRTLTDEEARKYAVVQAN